jgi:hypothetical protein
LYAHPLRDTALSDSSTRAAPANCFFSFSILAIDRCGGNQTFLGKRKKFDLAFHRQLEQHFPDWEQRMDSQKKQEEFYKSAMRKEREMKNLRIKQIPAFYTKEKLDAISYFQGTGFYLKHQDPKVKPNIFDTRQSFLFKMHDPRLRKNF